MRVFCIGFSLISIDYGLQSIEMGISAHSHEKEASEHRYRAKSAGERLGVIGQIVCPVLGVDAGQRPFFIE